MTDKENIKQAYNDAIASEQRGDNPGAIILYKKAISLGAKDVAVFLNLSLLYRQASRYNDAIQVLKNALQLKEGELSSNLDVAKIYNNLGNVYRSQGTYDMAIQSFEKALSLDSNMVGPNLNIGITYDVHMNNSAKAIPFYNREIELAPNAKATFEAYLNLAIYCQEVSKEYGKSIQYSRDAIRVNPDGFDRYKAYNCLANSLYLNGDMKLAVANWKKVVEIAPNTQSGRNARNNISAAQ